MSGVKLSIFVVFFLVFLQQPSFTAEIRLEKSFYQPDEVVFVEVVIWNGTSSKECLKTLDISIEDSAKLLCTITNSYPLDTECIEAEEEKVYTFSCTLPRNAQEGVASVEVAIETWNSIHVRKKTFFEIGVNYPPEIVLISYPGVVNPAQEYGITFSATDNFGVEDLVSVEVSLYQEGTRSEERGFYTFSWEKPSIYTVWEADSPVHVAASLQPNEIVWTVHFSLSEIAAPGEWVLTIEVYDTRHQHQQVVERFTVTKYLSFRLQDSTRASVAEINFGKSSPGEELPRVSLSVVVTSNSYVNVFVQGADLQSLEGDTLPVDGFYVETVGGRMQLSGSRQGVYFDYAQKNGFSKEARILLVFWGTLPEVVEAGAYSGIWYIIVEAV